MEYIFIGGCGRSGTTLLGALLGNHSCSSTIPESQFIQEAIEKFDLMNGQLPTDTAIEIYRYMSNHRRYKMWDVTANEDRVYDPIEGCRFSDIVDKIVGGYFESINKNMPKYCISHTPKNIRHLLKLSRCFPKAKFIHIVRDGRAVFNSVKSLDWGPNTPIQAANWWMKNTAYGLAGLQAFNSEQILQINYESLLNDLEQTVRQICEFIGISFEADMLMSNQYSLPQMTLKQHTLVNKPIDSNRANAWRYQLSKREIELFELVCGEFLIYLGYDMVNTCKRKQPDFWEKRRFNLIEFINKYLINRVSNYLRHKGY